MDHGGSSVLAEHRTQARILASEAIDLAAENRNGVRGVGEASLDLLLMLGASSGKFRRPHHAIAAKQAL